MRHEDKQLLLKDLSARLVYEVKVKYWPDSSVWGKHISPETCLLTMDILTSVFKMEYSKKVCLPYLRPMSSMTEKEKNTYDTLTMCNAPWVVIDWLNSIHVDYRGLIPMGLAIEAPKGMYNIN